MTTVTLTTSVQQVLAEAQAGVRRWVILQNQGSDVIYLKLDGSSTTLSASNGLQLAAGASIQLSPGLQKGTDGQAFIEALGSSGGEKLHIQTANYDEL